MAKLDVHVFEEVEADIGATGQATGVVLLASLWYLVIFSKIGIWSVS